MTTSIIGLSRTLNLETPESPNYKFKGDMSNVQIRVQKKNYDKIKNKDYKPDLKWLPLSDLEPMESNRDSKAPWVTKMLANQDGLDMLAFGVLSVARDPNDGKYYVWDGNGRFTLAVAVQAITEVPCLVYDMNKRQAAYYFAYNQEKGRRKLDRDITFVNAFLGEDNEAKEWEQRLRNVGCYIESNPGFTVPRNPAPGTPKIQFRTLENMYKASEKDEVVMRQARDMIASAWGDQLIPQDLATALTRLLTVCPGTRSNGNNKGLLDWMKWGSTAMPASKFSKQWKSEEEKGLSGNASSADRLARSLARSFMETDFAPSNVRHVIKLGAFE